MWLLGRATAGNPEGLQLMEEAVTEGHESGLLGVKPTDSGQGTEQTGCSMCKGGPKPCALLCLAQCCQPALTETSPNERQVRSTRLADSGDPSVTGEGAVCHGTDRLWDTVARDVWPAALTNKGQAAESRNK